jgi:HPt (histidine-containing phosphotransfer) domain-containing protein
MVAHRLKGAAATLAANEVFGVARDLEESAAQARQREATRTLSRLEAAVSELNDHISRLRVENKDVPQ